MMKIETGHLLIFLSHCELVDLCLCAEVYCYRCAEDVKLMGHHRWQKLCKRLQIGWALIGDATLGCALIRVAFYGTKAFTRDISM